MSDLTTPSLAPAPITRPAEPLISCVIPSYNEAENLKVLIPQLTETLKSLSPRVEILVVDDGSTDNSAAVAFALSAEYPVKCVLLSRNFGKENALTAGIDEACGDVVILMDADMQHPLAMIPQFFAHWQQGREMIYGVRANRDDEGFWKRQFTHWFYRVLRRASRIPIEPDAGDFRMLDRKVVESLRCLPERSRFMKGLYAWVGFDSVGVPFEVAERHTGKSTFNFRRLTRLAVLGLVSFTDLPLRMSTLVGLGISFISIFYGVFEMVRTLITGNDTPGWATLVVAITFLNGVQLMAIGVVGEYIARIFNEVKGRPNYVIARRIGYDVKDGTVHR